MSRWGESRGVWCPWDVVERGGDRTVVAREAHRGGDVICRVPKDLAWEASADMPPKVGAGFVLPTYWMGADATSEKKGWYVKLALKLLYEKSLGEQSEWAAYLSLLPTHLDTLVHFGDAELEDLQNARLVRQVGKCVCICVCVY